MGLISGNRSINHVVISRVDAIGDAILTLPACIYLRKNFPDLKISFLGRTYTRPIIEACSAIDEFINFDDIKLMTPEDQITFIKSKNVDAIVHTFPTKQIAFLFKKAGVPVRIGTTSKNYHFFTCNRLLRLSRRNSDLHEAQQNIFLLKPLGLTHVPTLKTIERYYRDYFKPTTKLPSFLKKHLDEDKFNLIVHSKSNGNGREWDQSQFSQLIRKLPSEHFNILITGSEKEHDIFKSWIPTLPDHVIDLSGKTSGNELLALIYHADGLIASGTGPLHVAAASEIFTIGLFPTTRSINACRWAPVGRKAQHVESDSDTLDSISVNEVYSRIMEWVINDKRVILEVNDSILIN